MPSELEQELLLRQSNQPAPLSIGRPTSISDDRGAIGRLLDLLIGEEAGMQAEPILGSKNLGRVQTALDQLTYGHLDPEEGWMLGIMPMGSPIRNPQTRAKMLEQLKANSRGFSPHIQRGVDEFITKYPRLSAHLRRIDPLRARNPAHDSITTGAFVSMPRPLDSPAAILELNPNLTSTEAARNVLKHEGTHLADAVRIAGQRRRAMNPEVMDPRVWANPQKPVDAFRQDYEDLTKQFGYWNNPMEIRARVTRELRDLPRNTPNRWEIAKERAMDPLRADVRVARDLGLPGPSEDLMVDDLIHQLGGAPKGMSVQQIEGIGASLPGSLGEFPKTISIPRGGKITQLDAPPVAQPRPTEQPWSIRDLIDRLLK